MSIEDSYSSEQRAAIAGLLARGRHLLDAPRKPVEFTTDAAANVVLNDLEGFPHLYVLGCVMDRQMVFSRAWLIPYRVGLEIGGFDFASFEALSEADIQQIFADHKLHRFNKVAGTHFFKAIRRIDSHYAGKAAHIWDRTPPSACVIRRFLEFDGVGIKIATMATNILVREFKIPMTHLSAIDISPDRRVTRFFKERGLIREDAGPMELIYLARELSPEFPGLLDYGAFMDGGSK